MLGAKQDHTRKLLNVARYFSAGVVFFSLLVSGSWLFAESLVEKGERLYREGKFDQALVSLVQAEVAAPDDARGLSTLGRTYFHLGEYSKAGEKLKKSLSANRVPEWVRCWGNVYLAQIETSQGEFLGAEKRLEKLFDKHYSPVCEREAKRYMAFSKTMEYGLSEARQKLQSECCTIHYSHSAADADGVMIEEVTAKIQAYADEIADILVLEKSALPHVDIYLHPDGQSEEVWRSQEVIARYHHNEFHVTHKNIDYSKHELVHFFTADRIRVEHISPALVEGVAEYVVGRPWGIPLHGWVNYFRANGDYVPLHELLDKRRFRRINPIVAYEEAGSFVQFFIVTYGLNNLFAVLEGTEHILGITGKTLREVEDEWLRKVSEVNFSDVEAGRISYRLNLGEYYHSAFAYEGKPLPRAGFDCGIIEDEIVITEVEQNSLAQNIGLQEGDTLRSVQNVSLQKDNLWHISQIMMQHFGKEKIIFEIERSGRKQFVSIPASVQSGRGGNDEM